MTYLLIAGLLFWLALMLWLNRSGHSGFELPNDEISEPTTVSIVVAFRNEEAGLSELLDSLNDQQGLGHNLEVLLVNDHSDDASVEIISKQRSSWSKLDIVLLNNEQQGKKSAVLMGLQRATKDWVFLTDADCTLGKHHIATLLAKAINEDKQVAFAPVKFREKGWFERMQAFENANTQMITLAFMSLGKPLMANGANILIHRDQLSAYRAAQRMEYPGGDDVFFAQSLSAGEYTYCYHHQCILETKACSDFGAWYNQRLRWVSKTTGYSSALHWLFAIGFIAFQILYALVLLLWLMTDATVNTFFLFILLKWVIDYTVHRRWAAYFSVSLKAYEHVLVSVIYPFYSILLGALSLLPLTFEWKERRWKTTMKTS